MYKKILDAIIEEFHTAQCIRDVGKHWSFRSTVPGPNFREACHHLAQRHRANGLETTLTQFPADDKTEWLGGTRLPLEWTPRNASLSVVSPQREQICSYANEPLCLVSSSTSTPAGGVDAEVIVPISGGGGSDADFGGQDVRGKIIFTSAFWDADHYARTRGALGIISDTISPPWLDPRREPSDLPDATQWRTFSGAREANGLWGFMLTPVQGRRLRDLIRNSPAPVILHADVDADLKEGLAEFVHARLAGTDLAHEEIWVTAHASEPGARDNAAGCAMSLELGRALKALVDSGRLPPLRRSIRFMHGVEVCGFAPYIESRLPDMHKVVAGINLDSVGQDFSICGGDCQLIRSDEKNASFVDGLLSYLFTVVAEEPNKRFTRDNYETFPWHTIGFRGDDACISDGFFDIPTPAIFTWPDRFYHTNMDTADQMSENTMGRNAAIAGAYLYLMATLGPKDVPGLVQLTLRDWKQRIVEALDAAVRAGSRSGDQLFAEGRHLGLLAQDALTHILRLTGGDTMSQNVVQRASDDIMRFATAEGISAAQLSTGSVVSPISASKADLSGRGSVIYKRLHWHHPKPDAFSDAGRAEFMKLQSQGKVQELWEWLNGRRNLDDAYARANFAAEIPARIVVDYMDLLERESFVRRL